MKGEQGRNVPFDENQFRRENVQPAPNEEGDDMVAEDVDLMNDSRESGTGDGDRKIYINAMIEQAELGRNPRKGGKGPSEKRFIFNGVNICPKAWCAVQGISKTCFFEHRKAIQEYEVHDTTAKLSRRAEREKYYKHGFKAKHEPKKYLSIIIDGMDQSKHNLSHFQVTTKVDSTATRLKTHVTGVLANCHSMASAFLDNCEWPHDSNLTINILMRTLLLFQGKLDKLPPVMYLQMDNCYRECKNKFVLGFLAILVKMGLFRKIKLSFLMVGHTHEDIDQMFSCFSRHLAKHDARTIPELFAEMESSYTPKPSCEQLRCMFDVKKWMDGYVEDKISGHVHQQQFKFEMKNGKVLTFYKKWSTSKDWILLKPKDNPDPEYTIVQSIPNGSPTLIKPSFDPLILTKITHDLVKFNAKFDDGTINWWTTLIKNLESGTDLPIPW
ncbi:Hypothetical predicted protein [Paramuricea clavata]|uniref:DUF7869 domain-containing protein n=1 Tax=Paramuricea clavata TaxID=317549 RepID=A0A6S7LII6_PARCT|nr:Hypothetical predicted protein [Paramuricea clavata]